jgi:hypothetical protein
MTRHRFIYWVHTNPQQPSRIFKRKRDAMQWGRDSFPGIFIVEPIVTTKAAERIEYIRKALGYTVTAA